jgi:3-phenylpropionate/cinnamic acid dioxygenase small subunit
VTAQRLSPELRAEIQDLYDAYAEALDDGELERWPALFTEKCLYEVVPRENFDRGLPLAVILCESAACSRTASKRCGRHPCRAPCAT